jgi:hypothetical protein
MYRTFVIVRHTFLDTIVQPIYSLLIAVGVAILVIFAMLPFFTLGEDAVMFKSVGLDVMMILVLVATLFATSKSIFEEIEDRTMLTLMSKPVQRWQVLIGKYLGIILAALLAIAILGLILSLCTWFRVPSDYRLNTISIDPYERKQAWDYRVMHLVGLLPSFFLMWMQISVLAAIGVALSTRFSLVVNLPTVILFYLAGNLTRFLFPMDGPGAVMEGRSALTKGLAYVIGTVLPFLEVFDYRPVLFRPIMLAGTDFANHPNGISVATLWGFAGAGFIYFLCYVTFALSAGMLLFQTRELGGAEG